MFTQPSQSGEKFLLPKRAVFAVERNAAEVASLTASLAKEDVPKLRADLKEANDDVQKKKIAVGFLIDLIDKAPNLSDADKTAIKTEITTTLDAIQQQGTPQLEVDTLRQKLAAKNVSTLGEVIALAKPTWDAVTTAFKDLSNNPTEFLKSGFTKVMGYLKVAYDFYKGIAEKVKGYFGDTSVAQALTQTPAPATPEQTPRAPQLPQVVLPSERIDPSVTNLGVAQITPVTSTPTNNANYSPAFVTYTTPNGVIWRMNYDGEMPANPPGLTGVKAPNTASDAKFAQPEGTPTLPVRDYLKSHQININSIATKFNQTDGFKPQLATMMIKLQKDEIVANPGNPKDIAKLLADKMDTLVSKPGSEFGTKDVLLSAFLSNPNNIVLMLKETTPAEAELTQEKHRLAGEVAQMTDFLKSNVTDDKKAQFSAAGDLIIQSIDTALPATKEKCQTIVTTYIGQMLGGLSLPAAQTNFGNNVEAVRTYLMAAVPRINGQPSAPPAAPSTPAVQPTAAPNPGGAFPPPVPAAA